MNETGGGETAAWTKAKVTPQQWDEIRQRYENGETAASLAQEFGVRAYTIWHRVGKR
jgi:hypothetical protein